MKVCVFGAGNMGARITEVFLTNGHEVTMLDVKQEFIDRGVKTITNDLSFLVKKEKMTEEKKNELLIDGTFPATCSVSVFPTGHVFCSEKQRRVELWNF